MRGKRAVCLQIAPDKSPTEELKRIALRLAGDAEAPGQWIRGAVGASHIERSAGGARPELELSLES